MDLDSTKGGRQCVRRQTEEGPRTVTNARAGWVTVKNERMGTVLEMTRISEKRAKK